MSKLMALAFWRKLSASLGHTEKHRLLKLFFSCYTFFGLFTAAQAFGAYVGIEKCGNHRYPIERLCETQLPLPIILFGGAVLFVVGTWLNFRGDDFTFRNQGMGWIIGFIGGAILLYWGFFCL